MRHRFFLRLSWCFLKILLLQLKCHHLNICLSQTSLFINLKCIRMTLFLSQPKHYLLISQSHILQELISQTPRQFINHLPSCNLLIFLFHFHHLQISISYLFPLYYSLTFLLAFHFNFTLYLIKFHNTLALLL